jgi:propanol-preferring alcohol dehydrogenase
MKKLREAGVVGPDRMIGVIGVGGLGTYGIQYAKLLGSGATVVAFEKSDEKLAIAKEYGADHIINTKGKSTADIRLELQRATGSREIDAGLDCAGAEDSIRLGFDLLATAGAYVSVGLMGTKINLPLFPFVDREFTYHGSFWGSYSDLSEVIALAQAGKIKHSLVRVPFADINKHLEMLRDGDIVGRAVLTFAETGEPRREKEMVA